MRISNLSIFLLVSLFFVFLMVLVVPLTVRIVQQMEEQLTYKIEADEGASLTLSSGSQIFYVGQPFKVKVLLNTGRNLIDSIDVVINFDQDILEGVGIQKGTIEGFKVYPVEEIDNSSGVIFVSANIGIDQVQIPVQGQTLHLATVIFKSKKQTLSTTLSFDFTSGERNDSNIVKFMQAEDVLTGIRNLSIAVAKTGDISVDEKVNALDASILMSNWGQLLPWVCPPVSPSCNPDLNGDGKIDGGDASIIMSHWMVL